MRQIADLSARSLHDAAIIVDQRVHFARERRDFVGQIFIQPRNLAFANIGEGTANTIERTQTEQDHGGVDQRAAKSKYTEVKIERITEMGNFAFDLAQIPHNPEPGNAIFRVEHNFGFDDGKLLAVGTWFGIRALKRCIEGNIECRGRIDLPVTQRDRFAANPSDCPPPVRQTNTSRKAGSNNAPPPGQDGRQACRH